MPFKTGDIVTVSPTSDIKGAGLPHVVIEIIDPPFTDQQSESGSNQFLRKFTMRVAHFHGDSITQHAVDHGSFEAWTPEHAEAWMAAQAPARPSRQAVKATPETPLTDIIRLLRTEARKLGEAKIVWKKGDLVEILGHQASNAAEPMAFSGRSIGVVEVVDNSDETTRVIYFDSEGERRSQWFKPVDLKPFTLETVVSDNEG